MATVVNARDVLLQAASVRVATVTMASNLVVDQSQVTGLGVQVAGTKMVSLATTGQAFLVPSVGAVSPSAVTLTATSYNLPAATLSVVSGTITPTPTLVNGTVTIPASNFMTDVVVVRISSTSGSDTYTDDVTFVKTYEGATALATFLTNEIAYMSADYLGNALSYAGVNGTFKVYQGTSDITNLCTYSLAPGGNPSNLAYVLNAANGTYSVTGGYPVGTTSTTLTIRATFGATTVDKVFTIRKTMAPAPSQRGSRTWYVGLTGSTNTYSDSLATTTASADGGPILNDTVTQYNNAMGFSQTKFWTGTSWIIVNAVVDGNLLVSGTVGASAMSVNSVTASNGAIADLTVGTLKIKDQAVTVPLVASFQPGVTFANGLVVAAGTGTETVIGTTGNVTYSVPANLIAVVSGLFWTSGTGQSADPTYLGFRVYDASTNLEVTSITVPPPAYANYVGRATACMATSIQLPAGTYYFKVVALTGAQIGSNSTRIMNVTIGVIGAMK